ncbi:MAG TPA: hypothetical protein PLD93_06470 [Synergistaceae bacterium]|nr:hypothetical protein [Synergistaceae bacterium]
MAMSEALNDADLNRARAFIAGNDWIFAKTYAKTAPHEYVVKTKLPSEEMQKEFEWFAMLIRQKGYETEFWGTIYMYLDIDGKKYWTMGEPLEETIILNRADL